MAAKVYRYDPTSGRMVYVGTSKIQPRERVRLPASVNTRMDKSMGENIRTSNETNHTH